MQWHNNMVLLISVQKNKDLDLSAVCEPYLNLWLGDIYTTCVLERQINAFGNNCVHRIMGYH